MLTLCPESVNVQRFKTWCVSQNQSFDICLGTRPGSLEEIQSKLTPYGYYNMFNPRETHAHFNTLGVVGCFMGHQSAWRMCQDRKEPTWIFEEGTSSYNTEAFQSLEHDHPDFDFILGHSTRVWRSFAQSRIGPRWSERGLEAIDKIYYGLKCYRISPRFATLALQESKTFDLHVDSFLPTLAIYHRDTFLCGRTPKNIVTAGSSGLINHSTNVALLQFRMGLVIIVTLSVLLVMVSTFAIITRRKYDKIQSKC